MVKAWFTILPRRFSWLKIPLRYFRSTILMKHIHILPVTPPGRYFLVLLFCLLSLVTYEDESKEMGSDWGMCRPLYINSSCRSHLPRPTLVFWRHRRRIIGWRFRSIDASDNLTYNHIYNEWLKLWPLAQGYPDRLVGFLVFIGHFDNLMVIGIQNW